ncbi:MAG: hypothetical protein DLM72_13060 [Candidatus Nitrosopolaris wilkensis]|nr:MAG: hypothetical protein DLM72_13060 [Candidatus Nitrosopolaris wilkensis]
MHDFSKKLDFFNVDSFNICMDYIDSIEIRKVQALTGERSLTLVLPKQFATELRVVRGDYMKCRVDSGRLIVEKMIP